MDIASLGFAIDTSQVQSAVQHLDSLTASSDKARTSTDALTQGHVRFQAETANAIARISQLRAEYQQTTSSLDSLLLKMDATRAAMSTSGQALAGFAQARQQVEALGLAYNQTSTSLEAYTRQSQQLGLSSAQTVLSLQRITDALQNQTAAGQALRQIMTDYGVTMSQMSNGNAAQALQAFVDRMKSVADSAQKFRAVQAVLGPIDAPTYASLNDRDYVPLATQYQRQRSAADLTAANTVARSAQLGQRSLDQDAAEYSDLDSRYTNYGGISQANRAVVARALGSGSNFAIDGTSTQAGRLSLYRYLAANPNSQAAQQSLTVRGRIGQAYRGSYLEGLYNQFSGNDEGLSSANDADIEYRYNQEAANSRGLFGSGFGPSIGTSFLPGLRFLGRSTANAFNGYTAPGGLGSNDGPLADPEAEGQRLSGIGGTIGRFGFGDGGIDAGVRANRLLRNYTSTFGQPGADKQILDVLGSVEGNRVLGNISDQLGYSARTAGTPGQADIDEAGTQGWLLSVPRAQRNRAQALLSYAQKNAPDVRTSGWAQNGLDLSFLTDPSSAGPGTLGPQNLSSFKQIFGGQQANLGTSMDQDSAQAIDRQKALTAATDLGSASVEDLTTKWQAYDAALKRGADTDNLAKAQQQALLELTEKRATASEALIANLNRQNRASDALNAAVAGAGSDPAARAAAANAAGISNDILQQQADGRLNGPGEADRYRTARQNALGSAATGDANNQLAAGERQLQQQQQLLSVANQRADVQAKMARDQSVDDAFAKDLAGAQGDDARVKAIQDAIAKMKELKDETAAVNAEAALFKIGNDGYQSAANENYIRSLPPSQQARARAQMSALTPFQNGPLAGQTGGIPSSGFDDASGGPAGSATLPPSPAAGSINLSSPALRGSVPSSVEVLIRQQTAAWNQANPQNPINPDFAVAIAQLEGGTNANGTPGVSSAGAIGAMQLMPDTAAGLGVNPWNQNDNIRGGIAYIGQLQQRFGGNQLAVGAAYNAGPGRAGQYATTGDLSTLPRESQDYVNRLAAAGLTGAVVSPQAALAAAQANPGGVAALGGTGAAYDAGVAGQLQELQLRQQAVVAQNSLTLPLLAAGQTGAAAYARAGVVTDPYDPLGPQRAQIAQQNVTAGQQADFASKTYQLGNAANQNNALAAATAQGPAAVQELNNEYAALALTLSDKLTPAQTAQVKALEDASTAAKTNLSISQQLKSANDNAATNAYQLSLGPAIGQSGQQDQAAAMAMYKTQQQIANTPGITPEQSQALTAATALNNEQQKQLQSQKDLSAGFTSMESAINSAFASAITGGGNFRSVLAGLTQDIAKIAIQMALKPAEDSIGSSISSLFGGLFGGSAALTGTGLGIDGMAGTSAAAQAAFNSSIPAMSPGAAIGLSTGGVLSRGRVRRFASGGVLDRPTTWAMSTGDVGLAGEMDNEAVMPLTRLPNGNLGVASGGSGGGGGNITVNTPITINGGQSGQGGQMDQKTAMALQKQIESTARAAVKNVIADERRPGGDLYV